MAEINEENKKWYEEQRPLYEALCKKVENIIREVLIKENIPTVSVNSRVKTIESYVSKIDKEIDYDPKDMQDLAGVRVITYINSDVEKASKAIKKLFNVDQKLSRDKSKFLKPDTVGYKSEHIVATFTAERLKLPEFDRFVGMKFEIQIRTVLQHAWAEIEHDRSYKFGGVLPENIQRRFFLVAGQLEIADNEFEAIADAIIQYSKDVSQKTKEGNLDITIDSTSLQLFLSERFGDTPGLIPSFHSGKLDLSGEIISRFKEIDITTLDKLEKTIPDNFKQKYAEYFKNKDFTHISARLLNVINPDEFYTKLKGKRIVLNQENINFAKEFGIDASTYFKKYNITVIS